MWFSLLCLAVVLAVAIKVSAQGAFGAFLMLVLTICCAAAAYGTHEWVAIHWVVPNWKPDYALPVALGVVFGVSLLILRLIFDRLIRRACLVPALVDKIGGGVFGLLTGLIMAGVLATCVQMIPFNHGVFLGFSRVPVVDRKDRSSSDTQPASRNTEERGLILSPDRFAAGLTSALSDGIFSGENDFYQHHPNLMQTIGWVGSADVEVSRFAPPGSISIVRTALIPYVYKMTPGDERQGTPDTYEPQPPLTDYEYHMIRVRLSAAAQDAHKSHFFTLRQFRLVGTVGDTGLRQYHAVALQQRDSTDVTNRHIRSKKVRNKFWPVIDDAYAPRSGNHNEVEIVFELPAEFKPQFLEYKREARARVSFKNSEVIAETTPGKPAAPSGGAERSQTNPSKTAAASTAPAAPSPTRKRSGRGRRHGGRVRAVGASSGGSHFGDDLPVVMQSYQALRNAEISRGLMVGGHLIGEFDAQAEGTQPAIRKFDVPRDKRLLHLRTEGLQSKSTLGKALSQAVRTAQNYFVTDARGRRYKIIGKYAIATVNGTKIVEVQYFKDQAGTIGGLGKFSRIDETRLTARDHFALLFLVDPGARIVSFSTGGAATRRDDLTAENLTAPK